ncbi:uncharacterized protein LOC114191315 [Vigna unguiculata]|uniref:uncharacterized protein LOC114191315 n=1 Tax=Vigna unguiculata TaxID=3917 RepID=UPI0010165D95|nr:uncharacterized protein LOC114191315 [Vigna unguiculata]
MDHIRFNKTLILIGALSCLLLSTVASARHLLAAPVPPELTQFCSGTDNPALCVDTIAPVLAGNFDPVRAVEGEINATLQKASEIAASISKQLEDPATAKEALDALNICKTQYDDMLDSIKEALNMVVQMNVMEAYRKMSAVISYKSSCDDAYTESPGVEMPFRQEATTLFQLSGNCVTVLNTIVKTTTV